MCKVNILGHLEHLMYVSVKKKGKINRMVANLAVTLPSVYPSKMLTPLQIVFSYYITRNLINMFCQIVLIIFEYLFFIAKEMTPTTSPPHPPTSCNCLEYTPYYSLLSVLWLFLCCPVYRARAVYKHKIFLPPTWLQSEYTTSPYSFRISCSILTLDYCLYGDSLVPPYVGFFWLRTVSFLPLLKKHSRLRWTGDPSGVNALVLPPSSPGIDSGSTVTLTRRKWVQTKNEWMTVACYHLC